MFDVPLSNDVGTLTLIAWASIHNNGVTVGFMHGVHTNAGEGKLYIFISCTLLYLNHE